MVYAIALQDQVAECVELFLFCVPVKSGLSTPNNKEDTSNSISFDHFDKSLFILMSQRRVEMRF